MTNFATMNTKIVFMTDAKTCREAEAIFAKALERIIRESCPAITQVYWERVEELRDDRGNILQRVGPK